MQQNELIIHDIESATSRISKIYQSHGTEAGHHLERMKYILQQKGEGFLIVRSWFVSTPQKWLQVEPIVYKLYNELGTLEVEKILSIPHETISGIIQPIGFQYQLATGLKKFAKVIKDKYGDWSSFIKALNQHDIFEINREFTGKGTRITFKNLAAMYINLGITEQLPILDKHVGKTLGLTSNTISKIRTNAPLFRQLLSETDKVTELAKNECPDVTTTRWSLAAWFFQSKTKIADLENVCSKMYHSKKYK